MADGGLLHIKGLSELQKLLDTLPAKIEKNVMRGALREGAKVLLTETTYRAPHKQAGLVSSLRVGTRSRGGTVTGYVKTDLFYARFVEYGTRPHFISVQDDEKPINKQLSFRRGQIVRASMTTVNRNIRSLKISGNFVGPTVHHPGAQPKPFMRPSLDTAGVTAIVAAGEYMKKRLETKQGLETAHILVEGDEP